MNESETDRKGKKEEWFQTDEVYAWWESTLTNRGLKDKTCDIYLLKIFQYLVVNLDVTFKKDLSNF